MGYGKTQKDVLKIAEAYASSKEVLRKQKISDGWWRRFRERQNGLLVLRKGDSTSFLRMNAMNKDTLNHYFDLLEETMKENNLLNSPTKVYNVDETGIPLDPKTPKVITVKGTKKVRYQSTGRKGQITVVACGNAAGHVLPPLIIFDAKNIRQAWTRNEVPGSKYGASDNGWINTDLFESWFYELFLPNPIKDRPLLLLLDGHSTHYQPDIINVAKEHDVIVLCLPPHTSHSTQPLDCGVFSPLKAQWKTACHDFFQKNPGKIITKFNFNELFSQSWLKSLVPANLIAGFKTCGICPLNRKALKAVPYCSGSNNSDEKVVDSIAANSNEVFKNISIQAGSGQQTTIESVHSKNVSIEVEEDEDFSPEEKLLYNRRFEEGYNLSIDPKYNRWLRKKHPELLLPNQASNSGCIDSALDSVLDVARDTSLDPLDSHFDTYSQIECEGSILQEFSDVRPLSPIIVVSESLDKTSASKSLSENLDKTPENISITGPGASTSDNSSTSAQTSSLDNSSNRALSQLLANYTPQVTPIATSKKPRARLLTSDDCLRMLNEKEAKKQAEEKEQRQKDREDKKRQREEEAKRKAEEKERKAAKRAEEKAQKDALRAQKEAEKAQKAAEKATRITRQSRSTNRKCKASEFVNKDHGTTSNREIINEQTDPDVSNNKATDPRSSSTLDEVLNTSIDSNVCCICFGNYEDDVIDGYGADWIDCACGRWLHVDCADECVTDCHGNKRYCPYCVDGLIH